MTDSLDSELDALFQLPPAAMVEARNALADKLKKAGDREGAARIKSLKRPTPGAWALNQVHFQHPALLERARAQVGRLRELHATNGVQQSQLKAAAEAQRMAIQAVVDAAGRCLGDAGLTSGPPLERKLFTTVQGWLGGSGDEAPGRMTHDLEPSGFEALGLLGVPAPFEPGAKPTPEAAPPAPPAPPSPPPKAAKPTPAPKAPARDEAAEARKREIDRIHARIARLKQSAEWAAERVKKERAAEGVVEHERARAARELEDAEKLVLERRERLAQRERALEAAQAEVRDAQRAKRAADQELAQARAEVAKLEKA